MFAFLEEQELVKDKNGAALPVNAAVFRKLRLLFFILFAFTIKVYPFILNREVVLPYRPD